MIGDIAKCSYLLYSLYRLSKSETEGNMKRVKDAAYVCGAVGVKLIQFLVMREAFGSSVREEFSDFFDDCVVHPWHRTASMYKDKFKRNIEDDYRVNLRHPIGSGSMGQVYRMYSYALKRDVAVKVKHPNTDRDVRVFIDNVNRVFKLFNKLSLFPMYDLIDEFMRNIVTQLDYRTEAENMRKMKTNFSGEERVVIPEVFDANDTFLIMDYIPSTPMTQLKNERLKASVCLDISFIVLKSLMLHDFVHCDLHYGNWGIANIDDIYKQQRRQSDGKDVEMFTNDYRIVLYDFGIMGSTGSMQRCRDIMDAFYLGNLDKMCRLMVKGYDEHPRYHEMQQLLKDMPNTIYTERYSIAMNRAIKLGMQFDHDVMRCLHGLIMCERIFKEGFAAIKDALVDTTNPRDKFCLSLCYQHGILTRWTDRYQDLRQEFAKWIESEPWVTERFGEWLMDNFGHDDMEVFLDVIMKCLDCTQNSKNDSDMLM